MEKSTNSSTQEKVSETENADITALEGQGALEKGAKEEGNRTGEDVHGGDNFVELFEESLKSIQEGEVVRGEIVQVDKEYVLVDIGGIRWTYSSNGEKVTKEPSFFPRKRLPK
jgi:small subunit ribosomal protein S1